MTASVALTVNTAKAAVQRLITEVYIAQPNDASPSKDTTKPIPKLQVNVLKFAPAVPMNPVTAPPAYNRTT